MYCGIDVAGPPDRIEAGYDGGEDGQRQSDGNYRKIQMNPVGHHQIVSENDLDTLESRRRHCQTEDASEQADETRLYDMLQEQRALVRTQCLTHADLARLAEELREQQSYGIEQADREKHRRESRENPGFVG